MQKDLFEVLHCQTGAFAVIPCAALFNDTPDFRAVDAAFPLPSSSTRISCSSFFGVFSVPAKKGPGGMASVKVSFLMRLRMARLAPYDHGYTMDAYQNLKHHKEFALVVTGDLAVLYHKRRIFQCSVAQ